MIPAFVNPHARLADAAAEAVRRDPRFDLIRVGPAELQEAIARRVEEGAGRIAVLGGDGTLATAAGVLLHQATPLAVIPAGTRNHFARTFGIPLEFETALDVAAEGVVRRADVGVVNGRVFLNTSSVGSYVTLVRRRERLRPFVRYHLSGLLAAVSMFGGIPEFSLEIEIEGQGSRAVRTPLVFIGVGERDLRVRSFGERLGDGPSALHAVVVTGRSRARMLAIALTAVAHGIRGLYQGPHTDAYFADECTIHLSRPAASVALDGDIHRLTSPLRYSIARDALPLVLPRKLPAHGW